MSVAQYMLILFSLAMLIAGTVIAGRAKDGDEAKQEQGITLGFIGLITGIAAIVLYFLFDFKKLL